MASHGKPFESQTAPIAAILKPKNLKSIKKIRKTRKTQHCPQPMISESIQEACKLPENLNNPHRLICADDFHIFCQNILSFIPKNTPGNLENITKLLASYLRQQECFGKCKEAATVNSTTAANSFDDYLHGIDLGI